MKPTSMVSRAFKRVGGFAINVALQALASLVLVPATIGAAGISTWSSVVLAQAIGLVVATIVALGYGMTGPAAVATKSLAESASYVRSANCARIAMSVPCIGAMIAIMFAVPNPAPALGLLGGATVALGGLSNMFFFVGRAAPTWLLWTETLPKVLLTISGATTLALGAPVAIGLSLPVVGAVAAIGISNYSIYTAGRCGDSPSGSTSNQRVFAELRAQVSPAASSLLRGARDALPVVLLTAVAPGLVGTYGLFDRLARQTNIGLSPVAVALQGWVPKRIAADANTRSTFVAVLGGVVTAFLGFGFCVGFGTAALKWLSAGSFTPDTVEVVLLGVIVGLTLIIQVVNTACLVPLGNIRGVILTHIVGILALTVALPALLNTNAHLKFVLLSIVIAYSMQFSSQILVMSFTVFRASRIGPAADSRQSC